MKNLLKTLLVFSAVLVLASCKPITDDTEEPFLDCALTPEHEDCVTEEPDDLTDLCIERGYPERTADYGTIESSLQKLFDEINYRMIIAVDSTRGFDQYEATLTYEYDMFSPTKGKMNYLYKASTFDDSNNGIEYMVWISEEETRTYSDWGSFGWRYFETARVEPTFYTPLDYDAPFESSSVIFEDGVTYDVFTSKLFSSDGLADFYDSFAVMISEAGLEKSLLIEYYDEVEITFYVNSTMKLIKKIEIDFTPIFDELYGDNSYEEFVLSISYEDYDIINIITPIDATMIPLEYVLTPAFERINYNSDLTDLEDIVVEDSLYDSENKIYYLLDRESSLLYSFDYENDTFDEIEIPNDPVAIYYSDGFIYVATQTTEASSDSEKEQEGVIVLIDTTNFSVDSSFEVSIDPHDIIVDNNGIVVVSSASGQHTEGHSYKDGEYVSEFGMYMETIMEYSETLNKIYLMSTMTSPSDLDALKLDAEGVVIEYYDSIYHGDYRMNTVFRISPDGEYIYNGNGVLFDASDDRVEDIIFNQYLMYDFIDIAFDLENDVYYMSSSTEIVRYKYSTNEVIDSFYTGINNLDINIDENKLVVIGQSKTGEFIFVEYELDVEIVQNLDCEVVGDECIEYCDRPNPDPDLDPDPIVLTLDEVAIGMLQNVISFMDVYGDDQICDALFSDDYLNCASITINYLKENREQFKYSMTAVIIDNDTVEITIDRVDGNGYYTFLIDIEMTDVDGELISYISQLDVEWTTVFIAPTIEEVNTLMLSMIDDVEFDSEFCDAYFMPDATGACNMIQEFGIAQMVADIFQHTDMVVFTEKLGEYDFRYEASLEHESRISVTFRISIETTIDGFKISEIEYDDTSTYNTFDEITISIENILGDYDGTVPTLFCDYASEYTVEDCMHFTTRLSGLEMEYTLEQATYRTYNLFVTFTGLKNYTALFTVFSYVDQSTSAQLAIELEEYTIPEMVLTEEDAMEKLQYIFANDYSLTSNDDLCGEMIYWRESSLIYDCESDETFFQGIDNHYILESVKKLNETTFTFVAYSSDRTEKEDYYAKFYYVEDNEEWKIESYNYYYTLIMTIDFSTAFFNNLFEEYSNINSYEYCIFTTEETWFTIPEECLTGFFEDKTFGYRYELLSVTATEVDKVFIIEYERINALTTTYYKSEIELLEKSFENYYFEETILENYESSLTEGNEFTKVTVTYGEYLEEYLDTSITNQEIYDKYIIDNFDFTQFSTQRNSDLLLVESIVINTYNNEVTYLYNEVYIIGLTVNYLDLTSEDLVIHARVLFDEGIKITPLSKSTDYHFTFAEMKNHMENFIDAVYHEYLPTFQCSDLFSSTLDLTACEENQLDYVGNHVVDYFVEEYADNQFKATLIRLGSSNISYTQYLIFEVAIEKGEIVILSMKDYIE